MMNILVVGSNQSLVEFKAKFGSKHSIIFKNCTELSHQDLESVEIVFDFDIGSGLPHGKLYIQHPEVILFLNSVKTTLLELIKTYNWKNTAIGFNGLPGMFNRPLLELTCNQTNENTIQKLCAKLNTDYRLVKDRVGMVTPRVVCMIINEAFYTVQEGTAIESDIDLAMKLGTNYPKGPFEMLTAIGIRNVYELLNSMHRDTGEERYKICPQLKNLYLQQS